MVGALLVEWRSDVDSRLSFGLWCIALIALVILDAWAPLIALFGVNVGGRMAIQLLREGS
jgi:hypothetical protein